MTQNNGLFQGFMDKLFEEELCEFVIIFVYNASINQVAK